MASPLFNYISKFGMFREFLFFIENKKTQKIFISTGNKFTKKMIYLLNQSTN